MKNEMKKIPEASPELALSSIDVVSAASGGAPVKVAKRSVFQMLGGTLSLLCAAQLIVACQPKSGGGAPGAAAVNSPAQGTGDTGGGNGLNNKVFERYAVDITKSTPWLKYIAPIEDHIRSVPTLAGTSFSGNLTSVARAKTWFVAPVNLNSIQKETLGVEFIQDPIQQLALQTFGENAAGSSIWVDGKLYDDEKRTDLDRAYLQMHETVVGLYLVRFMPAASICKIFAEEPGTCEPSQIENLVGKHEPFRKLTKDDYEHIRSATAWLMENGLTIKDQTEIYKKLNSLNFDPRFFGERVLKTASSKTLGPKTMSLSDLASIAADSKVLGRMPNTCFMGMTKLPDAACDLSVTQKILTWEHGPGVLVEVRFSVTTKDGGTVPFIARRATPIDRPFMLPISARPMAEGMDQVYGADFGFALPEGQTSVHKGDDFYIVNFFFDENMNVTDVMLHHLRATSDSSPKTARDEWGNQVLERISFDYGSPAEDQRRSILISANPPSPIPYQKWTPSGTAQPITSVSTK